MYVSVEVGVDVDVDVDVVDDVRVDVHADAVTDAGAVADADAGSDVSLGAFVFACTCTPQCLRCGFLQCTIRARPDRRHSE